MIAKNFPAGVILLLALTGPLSAEGALIDLFSLKRTSLVPEYLDGPLRPGLTGGTETSSKSIARNHGPARSDLFRNRFSPPSILDKAGDRPDVSAGDLAVELASGLLGGVVAGGVGLLVGGRLSPHNESLGPFIGAIGYLAGTTAGVYLGGRSRGFRGSLLATTVGSLLGGSSGILFWQYEWTAVINFIALPPILAVIGFNATRKAAPGRAGPAALIRFRNGRFKAGFPSPRLSLNPVHLRGSAGSITLIDLSF